VPGMAIAAVCNNQVIHRKGYGVRQAGKDERVDADTVFQLEGEGRRTSAFHSSVGSIFFLSPLADLAPLTCDEGLPVSNARGGQQDRGRGT
jgi:Beta-lactamase